MLISCACLCLLLHCSIKPIIFKLDYIYVSKLQLLAMLWHYSQADNNLLIIICDSAHNSRKLCTASIPNFQTGNWFSVHLFLSLPCATMYVWHIHYFISNFGQDKKINKIFLHLTAIWLFLFRNIFFNFKQTRGLFVRFLSHFSLWSRLDISHAELSTILESWSAQEEFLNWP